ncbi:lipoprotein [Spiroplasma endosymbiont of Polydrusus pterygomalis]|uniref:lipoprotein n=1 Tax=Spiroplasma endosymbiont of Polydrusus pterygomalis TaxID=3139327 RepID=UPI003CCAC9AD
MKKILSILGTITLIGTSTTSLVACNKPQEYTPEELAKLKEENKIDTKDENIKNNLEWITPQEKPFNEVEKRYYYIVWKKDKWEISKILKNFPIEVGKEYYIYKDNNYELKFFKGITSTNKIKDTFLFYSSNNPFSFRRWGERNYDYINYIKSVYRWNLDTKGPDLIVDENGNVKVNE